jgi:hypothetical protein
MHIWAYAILAFMFGAVMVGGFVYWTQQRTIARMRKDLAQALEMQDYVDEIHMILGDHGTELWRFSTTQLNELSHVLISFEDLYNRIWERKLDGQYFDFKAEANKRKRRPGPPSKEDINQVNSRR